MTSQSWDELWGPLVICGLLIYLVRWLVKAIGNFRDTRRPPKELQHPGLADFAKILEPLDIPESVKMDAYDACFESPYSLYVDANHVRRQLWKLQIPDAVRYQLWERYLMWNKHPAGAPAKPQGKSSQEESGCFWKLVEVSFAICLVGLMVWMFIRVLCWFWDTPLFGG